MTTALKAYRTRGHRADPFYAPGSIVYAATASKARYIAALEIADLCPSTFEAMRMISVRRDPEMDRYVDAAHDGTLSPRRVAAINAADDWNATYPVGTPVRYWTGYREGPGKTSRTRSAARVAGSATACLWVEGEASSIALSHVEAL